MSDIVIVGGTGTLGKEIARQILAEDPAASICVLSRDELKQQEMRREFPRIRYVLGDIRDRDSLIGPFSQAREVFHCAALKHVDVCQENAIEAVKTNILGTENVIKAALSQGVRRVVFSSTDKAVEPINVYGNTKAIGERLVLSQNRPDLSTRFDVYRWANVLGSRGSVIHRFARTLMEHGLVEITDVAMTRFWIRIEDAVGFMLSGQPLLHPNEARIPLMKASSVVRMAEAVARSLGISSYDVRVVGIRPGEKIHESIAPGVSSDRAPQYSDGELFDLVEPILAVGWAAA